MGKARIKMSYYYYFYIQVHHSMMMKKKKKHATHCRYNDYILLTIALISLFQIFSVHACV